MQVIKQQVDVEVVVADVHVNLTTDKRKAGAEFDKKVLQMSQQPGFELTFVKRLFQRQEVKDVGILKQLNGEVRLRRRQNAFEVGDGFALPLVCLAVDLQ